MKKLLIALFVLSTYGFMKSATVAQMDAAVDQAKQLRAVGVFAQDKTLNMITPSGNVVEFAGAGNFTGANANQVNVRIAEAA